MARTAVTSGVAVALGLGCSGNRPSFLDEGRAVVVPLAALARPAERRDIAPSPRVETPTYHGGPAAERAPAPAATPPVALPKVAAAVRDQVTEATPEVPEPEPDVLVATSRETPIYARPSSRAPRIGYLRAGAVVARAPSPSGFDGCRGGFHEIVPEGFVCVGAGASLDARHELARAGTRAADRTATLPYVYGLAPAAAGIPVYSRIPSAEEQHAAEPRAPRTRSTAFDDLPLDGVPWFLDGGAPSIGVNGTRFRGGEALLRKTTARTGFAFLSLFESAGRRFGLTVDRAVVPLEGFQRVEPSRFHGLPLGEGSGLPVVFVRARSAMLYSGDPRAAGLTPDRRLEYREAIPVTGRHVQVGKVRYLETRAGGWLADQQLVRVDPRPAMPPWAASGRAWIDVSIDRQSLVAYQGDRPVFVTLVSTGADGTGDPETTHSTIQGEFLIHTKHVTATMDGDAVGDEFDLRDVPYVQYFKDGYALHAAYWHDAFGTPRSHGCVNLSPLDARWVFSFTEPSVPTAWHGALSTRGTLVSIHP